MYDTLCKFCTIADLFRALGLAVIAYLVVAQGLLSSLASRGPRFGFFHSQSVFQSDRVSLCQGYQLHTLQEDDTGLTASLALRGRPCSAFGDDIAHLTVQVSYESASRLHVNIFDTSNEQYTIPEDLIERPPQIHGVSKASSDFEFNYEAEPFAFWITRRSQPGSTPLFDTRLASLPQTPIPATDPDDIYANSTALHGFPFVFEKQYLQLTSALPKDANIYGLGEVVAGSGFRRNVSSTVQTMWARDEADPVDENIYGSHPVYLEHRFDKASQSSQSHGVLLLNAAGGDILLRTPPSSNVSLIQYRMIGGVLDFYFFSGPSPQAVIEQYGKLIGLPTWQPLWGFGFHLCRWGYKDLEETREQVAQMRTANIPLEVMWNDIDLYHAVRDFTTDPVSYPTEGVQQFIRELASKNQRYIPIVDAAIPKQTNDTDIYYPYSQGVAKDVFIKNPDGTEYIGQVWPGYTVFPDWFSKNALEWWSEALRNWSDSGVEFSGIWLDMNEASSFCDGSCGTGADLSNTSVPFILPGESGNLILGYPECYNSTIHGPSGNITVNGTLTCDLSNVSSMNKRGLGAGKQYGVDLNAPPYAIHNAFGRLSTHTLSPNATHVDGQVELDVHNLWGLMEEKTTHLALKGIMPGKRPFLISRSTFASSGRWTGHWLGDNWSLWSYLHHSIAGVLQFQIFQIPFVGADTCGFQGNTDEELCNRWMQLAAFTPFYRNHNVKGGLPQEPYRWDSVAEASRKAIAVRYTLLPYWYTLFAKSSMSGTPPVRALFFEFPDEEELFDVDSQFLVGRDILVTPVLRPNATTVDGYFPGRSKVVWRDWFTHEAVRTTPGQKTELPAPLGHINVHVRDGSAILLHAEPAYTIAETRQGPYSLLVSLDTDGRAHGTAYVDDGISDPPGPSRTLTFTAFDNQLHIDGMGGFHVQQRLREITVLGVEKTAHATLRLNGQIVSSIYDLHNRKLAILGLDIDLNEFSTLRWA